MTREERMATMAQDYERAYKDENRDYRWHGHAGRGRLRDESARPGERQYALFNHLAGLLSLIDFAVIGFVTSLVMWLVRREESEFLDDHGKEAVNFQISLGIYWIALFVIGTPLTLVTLGLALIVLVPIGIGLIVLRIIGCVCAALAANRGDFYRYPMCLRLIK
jgi:uncharacterized Tic20 family protein